MNTPAEAITIDDVRAAAQRLSGQAIVTPLLENPFINEIAGKRVLVKAECMQRTGSFKFRGAWSAISALDRTSRDRGVLAFSSGNHAQGIALAAQISGINAVIIMPNDAPQLKIDNTRSFGAEVVLYDRPGGENREQLGDTLAQQRGLHLIKPYDNAYVMAGQGTCGLEIAAQAKAMDIDSANVLTCCGGGGLTSGIAIALEAEAPGFDVRPVEPRDYDDVIRSQVAGTRQFVTKWEATICDAIVTPAPGELTFPIIHRLCKTGLTVTDQETLQAMGHAMQRLKVVAEPGGAVALAAALFHSTKLDADTIIAVISGGNTDARTLQQAMSMLA